MYDIWVLVALGGVGVVAGFVDAVAGGGGLITIPALLWAGLPPLGAIATNKAQSIVGTTMAAWTYWRKGYVSILSLVPSIGAAFAGSLLGAVIVKQVDTSALEVLIPVAVIAVALYFTFSPSIKDIDGVARLKFPTFVPVFALVIGFYDGVFGPGTGSFLMLAFVALFGLSAARASAHTKILNVTSNLAALLFFIIAGDVVWPVAIVMAGGQVIGGYLGAVTGIRYGARIIRPLVIVVSIILAVKLLFFP
ncbi:TSUP family transporter [Pelagibacterium flavum]|uniref:Probable membrane transporter protein n=1 Tax=Pelagibacterium flavum TaxID=2984530 RepID=A0ABY6IPB2_9HYPH|nr:TSUP family transporter [Pelagibacterium sp. YIM 151497]UYQ71555.1 TSUP family transporter [Pelagibacterium sp. YIM 151497]